MCRRYSLRIDSIFGFVVYGLLWFFFACGLATLALFVGIWIVGSNPGDFAKAVVLAAWLGGFVGAWVLYALWVGRRLGRARELVRNGVIVDAIVSETHRTTPRGTPYTHTILVWSDATSEHRARISIGGHPQELDEGRSVPVMFVRDYAYCAAFPIGGKMVLASRLD